MAHITDLAQGFEGANPDLAGTTVQRITECQECLLPPYYPRILITMQM